MDRPRVLMSILVCVAAICGGASASDRAVNKLIAYNGVDRTGLSYVAQVWMANIDGSRKRRLVRGFFPAVSPDGRWIAFNGGRGYQSDDSLYVIESNSGRRRLLARRSRGTVWSPDSDRVIVERTTSDGSSTSRLMSIDVESGQGIELVRGAGFHGWSYSPSGDEVVYARGGVLSQRHFLGQKVDLYVVGATGGDRRRLTRDGRSAFPVWGPDAIAFARVLPHRGWGRHEIWLIQPDGSRRRTLTGRLPKYLLGQGITGLVPEAWSGDGGELVAKHTNEFGGPPFAVDPKTGTIRKIGDFGFHAYAAGLSRDGRLVLVGEDGHDRADIRLSVVPYRGGPAKPIVEGAGFPSWNR